MHATHQKADGSVQDNLKILFSLSLAFLFCRPLHATFCPSCAGQQCCWAPVPPARGSDHSAVRPSALPLLPNQHTGLPTNSSKRTRASLFWSLQAHETATGPARWQEIKLCICCCVVGSQNHSCEPSLLPQHGWLWPGRVPEPPGDVGSSCSPPQCPSQRREAELTGLYLVISTTSSCNTLAESRLIFNSSEAE